MPIAWRRCARKLHRFRRSSPKTITTNMSKETETSTIEWKWGALAALGVMLLALWPQINMWIARGNNWQGSYVAVQGDEVAYSAYLNALIDGRPRRNDPYTGRDDSAAQPLPESLFSIQFVPAYAIAVPARLLGLTTSTTFIALIAIAGITSTLAIFWLLALVTGNNRLAACGALFVLCFGMLVASQGEVRVLLGLPIFEDDYFPFLRRYQPSAAFPLLFLLMASLWQALATNRRRTMAVWSIAAGLMLAVLVFSYFYLWTTAAAWLACVGLIWLAARPAEWRAVVFVFGIVGALGLAALAPYLVLLSHRAAETDASVLMIRSHAPDLLRVTELLSAGVLAFMAIQVKRGKLDWRDPRALFTVSLALVSFVVFNQQVLTGRSLQPLHYQIFVVNYVALLMIVLAIDVIWRGTKATPPEIPNRILALVTIAVFGWGIVEATAGTNRNITQARLRDDAMPVVKWMVAESQRAGLGGTSPNPGNPRAIVFASTLPVSETLPTGAPQAQLYVTHMAYYAGANRAEVRERFYQYMYYSGVSEKELAQAISEGRFAIMAALFGIERVITALAVNAQPITLEEMRSELKGYSEYIKSFTRERAGSLTLSYVVVPAEAPPDLTNLDRWYERDAGEKAGLFTIYRVKLKP